MDGSSAKEFNSPRRRASPPRPSLMVGDLEACRAAFARLQATCTNLLETDAGRIPSLSACTSNGLQHLICYPMCWCQSALHPRACHGSPPSSFPLHCFVYRRQVKMGGHSAQIQSSSRIPAVTSGDGQLCGSCPGVLLRCMSASWQLL